MYNLLDELYILEVIHMASNLLTAKQIEKIKPTEKTATYSDGNGMHLEVTSNGSKRWRFRYRYDGKAKLVSLGVYPDVSLADARTKRDDARSDVSKGIDPFPPKMKKEVIQSQQNQEKTFKQWSEWYMVKVADDVTETHLTRSLKGWKKDVYPIIGDMGINDVKPKHIIQILNIMSDRGAKESAKKVFSSISRVYDICIANYPDDIELNPTKSVSLKDVVGKTTKQHYPIITEAKELGTLLNLIDSYTGYTSIKLALKMIANVFVRPLNIRQAEWSEINLETMQWIIPSNKMKTRKELIVPLSIQVVEILETAKELYGADGLVFPSPKSGTQPLSDGALVGALRRIGYSSDEIVAHSFRGIFSTIAHEKKKYNHEVIETQLAHSVGNSVSQAYNRALHLKDRTNMMQWYSNLLQSYQETY